MTDVNKQRLHNYRRIHEYVCHKMCWSR